MTLSEVLTRVSFKKSLSGKSGSIYVEAAFILPVACFIIMGMIGLVMTFHSNVYKQAEEHIQIVAGWDHSKQIEAIRRYDRFIDWI